MRCVSHYLGADVEIHGGASDSSFCTLHKHGTVRVECSELRVEERECSLEECRALTKAVFRRAIVLLAVVMLYAGLATRFLCEERCSQAPVCVDHMILHGTYDCVISVTEGLKIAVYHKGATVRTRM